MHFTKGSQFGYILPEEFFFSDERRSATLNINVYDSEKTQAQVRIQKSVKRLGVEFHRDDYDTYVLPDSGDLDAIAAACVDIKDRNGDKTLDGWVYVSD